MNISPETERLLREAKKKKSMNSDMADKIAKEIKDSLEGVSAVNEVFKRIELLKIKGDKGDKGEDGYTPIKGVDYFDGIDGKDGKDGVGIDGKDGKDGKDGSPDTGEQIVEKINDLEIEPDKQIDFSHIKGFKQEVSKHTVGFQRNTAYFDDDLLIIDNPTRIKFTGAGVSLALDSTGMLIATISGSAGSETDEIATDSGDHTTFTILHTPNAGTLLVYNENTGQIYSPSNYTNTTTSITFNSSLAVEGETPVVRAKYTYA